MTKAFERAMMGLLGLVVLATIVHCGLVVGLLFTLCAVALVIAVPALFRGVSWMRRAEPQ